MRGMRMNVQPSLVGVDMRAALASWGSGDSVLGGVALLGCQPPGCPAAVDAVIVLPRAILVVVGVDLPEPAMRLEAPLNGTWKVDGWPLVRPNGPLNPATEVQQNTHAVLAWLRAQNRDALNVHTVIAVGPYVGEVSQPSTVAEANTVVLYPEPKALLATAKAAQGFATPFSVDQARSLIAALAPGRPTPTTGELSAEGFPDAVSTEVAAARTQLMPRVPTEPVPGRDIPLPTQPPPRPHRPPRPPQPAAQPAMGNPESHVHPRWLPIAAAVLLCVLLVSGILMAVNSAGTPPDEPPDRAAAPSDTSQAETTPVRPVSVAVDGMQFVRKAKGSDHDCAAHAFGTVRTMLASGGCMGLDRGAYATTANGQPAAVSVAVLRFSDEKTAQSFGSTMHDPNGGGVTDLVTDGHGWEGGPQTFDGAAFAMSEQGSTVRLTAAVWSAKKSKSTDAALKTLAESALKLP